MEFQHGYFANSGKEFVITNPDTPRNWYNYLYNDNYITFTSQVGTGEGVLQDNKGTRLRLVHGRAVYIVEDGEFYLANALPVEEERQEYSCTHGLGYSVIHVKKNDISTDYGLFVPRIEDTKLGTELSWVTVKNESDRTRTVSVISYVDTEADAVYTPQGYTQRVTDYHKDFDGICVQLRPMKWSGESVVFRAGMICSEPVRHYDCAKNAFIGTYGNVVNPKALARTGHCTDSTCSCEKACFALETEVTLAPGEQKRVMFACVAADSEEKFTDLRATYLTQDGFDRALSEVKAYYEDMLCDLKIETPFEDLDYLCNGWLPYATHMGSRWARVRHNGYRDMTSDTECLASFNPVLAAERIKRVLTYQYSNGYAPRTFYDGALRDSNFADCTVWLTFAVHTIVNELGDLSLLDEIVPFNDRTEASVYEHLRRSVDFLYNFKGHHNLVRIWGGDWNDNMNAAGLGGKGVSVWLTIAWYRANKQLGELAALLGKDEDVELCRVRADEVRDLVDEYGWDKEGYYIYAYNDKDVKIGSSDNEEGKIFLNPQLWAVLSGVSKGDKARIAMENAEKHLRRPLGWVVQTPPYTKHDPTVGTVTGGVPGAYENGSVYLHPMAWKLAVNGLLGRRDWMEQDLISMLPYRNPIVAGRAEPYSMFNCYFGEQTGYRYGTPGQSWRTASGQWMLKSVVHYLFGLRGCMEGLQIVPCIPASWTNCRITKTFRGATLHVSYVCGKDEDAILVNGEKIEGNIVAIEAGKVYDIIVYIKR